MFEFIFLISTYSNEERLPFFHQISNDSVCNQGGSEDCDFHLNNNLDNEINRKLFGQFNLQERTGYDLPVDLNNFCAIRHDKTCIHPDFDCPPPMNENHVYIHNAFNDYINKHIRNFKNAQSDPDMDAIKSVKFGTDSGVTLLNPAVFVQNCNQEDVDCESYDNRDKSWFRDVLYDNSGVDVVFWIDKSEQMRENYQSYFILEALVQTISSLSKNDRFSVVAGSSIKWLECDKNPDIYTSAHAKSQFEKGNFIPKTVFDQDVIWKLDDMRGEKDKDQFLYPEQCMEGKLSFATDRLKEYANYLLSRKDLHNTPSARSFSLGFMPECNLESNMDNCCIGDAKIGRFLNLIQDRFWQGNKKFKPTIEEIDKIFENSEQISGRKKVVILLTDGLDPIDKAETLEAWARLQNKNQYQIRFVGFSTSEKSDLMVNMANQQYESWHPTQNKIIGDSIWIKKDSRKDVVKLGIKLWYRSSTMTNVVSSPNTVWNLASKVSDIPTSSLTTSVSSSMIDSSGNLLGVINFEIDSDHLFQDLMKSSISTADLFLVDLKTEVVIYHPKIRRQVQHHISHFDQNGELMNLIKSENFSFSSNIFKCSRIQNNEIAVCVKIDAGSQPRTISLKLVSDQELIPSGIISSQMVPEFGFDYRFNEEVKEDSNATNEFSINHLNKPYRDINTCNWLTKYAPTVFDCSAYVDNANIESLIFADKRDVSNQVGKDKYFQDKKEANEGFARKCMYGARMGVIQSLRIIERGKKNHVCCYFFILFWWIFNDTTFFY